MAYQVGLLTIIKWNKAEHPMQKQAEKTLIARGQSAVSFRISLAVRNVGATSSSTLLR